MLGIKFQQYEFYSPIWSCGWRWQDIILRGKIGNNTKNPLIVAYFYTKINSNYRQSILTRSYLPKTIEVKVNSV